MLKSEIDFRNFRDFRIRNRDFFAGLETLKFVLFEILKVEIEIFRIRKVKLEFRICFNRDIKHQNGNFGDPIR